MTRLEHQYGTNDHESFPNERIDSSKPNAFLLLLVFYFSKNKVIKDPCINYHCFKQKRVRSKKCDKQQKTFLLTNISSKVLRLYPYEGGSTQECDRLLRIYI